VILIDSSAQEALDSIPMRSDTVRKVRISKDSLDTKVEYGARDSMRFDNMNNLVYLYGDAYVNYGSLRLTADFIQVNIDSNLAIAQAGRDSMDNLIGIPEFVDGPQKFNATRMKYNFKSKKGMVYEAVTQESDIYVRGTKTKYVGANDTLDQSDDVIYNKNAIFTTCNHPEPHYGIRSLKQKLVPNKLVVVGPSIVEVAGVPTPLILPFAFFPLTKGKRSGLIFPRDYEYSERWGFGLREIGYYIPINDYMDTRVMGDIYFNGSWGVSTQTTYKKRYKYNGNLRLAYSSRKQEVFNDYREQVQTSFRINWSHTQNNKANPFHNFSGNIDFQVNRFDQLNENAAANVLDNTIRSTVTYRRLFPGKPYTLTMALNHSQNNNTRDVSIAFPELRFNMRRIQPFKKQRAVSEKRWYDEIGVTYNLTAKSRYQTKDSLLFQAFDVNNLDYGVKHDVQLNANYNIFKYILFNSSVNYNEFWHFRQLQQGLANEYVIDTMQVDTDPNGNPINEIDTTQFGIRTRDTIQGFIPFRNISVSTGLSTKIFGTARFKGKLRGLRHIVTPSVSLRYSPDYRATQLEYWKSVSTDLRPGFDIPQEYSVFLSNAVGVPSVREEQFSLDFRIDNNFEAKYFSKKDSTEKKFRILDKLSIWTDYNIARETLKWNYVNMSTFTELFRGLTRVQLAAQFDPYAVRYDESGNEERINTFAWDETGSLLRFNRADMNVNTIFTIRQLIDLFKSQKTDEEPTDDVDETKDQGGRQRNQRRRAISEGSSLLDLFANFRVSHTIRFEIEAQQGRDTVQINNHYIELRGNLQISPKWSIQLGRIGYNFKQKRITYPDVGFTRDLHCWSLSFNWQPVYGTYSLFIGVKPGSLDFLKIPYRKNNIDTFF
jgi:hypothetical protein